MDEFFYAAAGFFILGSLFLFLAKTSKETKERESRVGDAQPTNLRKVAMGMIGMSLLCLFVAVFGHFFGRKN